MMGSEGNSDLHFWITRGMARRLGINLNEALRDGVLTRADLAEMVARCRTCSGAQGCVAYLSENPERAEAAPDWCRNARMLNELRAMR
jgi:hypothetical protein